MPIPSKLSTSPSLPNLSTSLSIRSIFGIVLLLLISLLPLPCRAADSSKKALYFNAGRGYDPFSKATAEGVLLSNSTSETLSDSIILPEPTQAATLSFRINNRHAHPSRNYTYRLPDGTEKTAKNPTWSLFLRDTSGQRLLLTISTQESAGPLSSEPLTHLAITNQLSSLSHPSAGPSESWSGEQASACQVPSSQLPFHGETLWSLSLTEGQLSIIAGAHEPTRLLTTSSPLKDLKAIGFSAAPGGEILLSDIALLPTPTLAPVYDPSALPINDQDPLPGYWQIFDRTLEESLLRLGGDYKIAVVKTDHDRYAIIYLAGAKVNAAQWAPGTVKGWLTLTAFPGLFDLEWFDAEGKPLSHSITAQLTDEGILTIQFPYQSSVIRLRKL